jgi:hypothetical protein
MDLSKVTRRELEKAAMQLNTRPRKGLGRKTLLKVIQQFAKTSCVLHLGLKSAYFKMPRAVYGFGAKIGACKKRNTAQNCI